MAVVLGFAVALWAGGVAAVERRGWPALWIAPALWVTTEGLRGVIAGFPWAQLGASCPC